MQQTVHVGTPLKPLTPADPLRCGRRRRYRPRRRVCRCRPPAVASAPSTWWRRRTWPPGWWQPAPTWSPATSPSHAALGATASSQPAAATEQERSRRTTNTSEERPTPTEPESSRGRHTYSVAFPLYDMLTAFG